MYFIFRNFLINERTIYVSSTSPHQWSDIWKDFTGQHIPADRCKKEDARGSLIAYKTLFLSSERLFEALACLIPPRHHRERRLRWSADVCMLGLRASHAGKHAGGKWVSRDADCRNDLLDSHRHEVRIKKTQPLEWHQNNWSLREALKIERRPWKRRGPCGD